MKKSMQKPDKWDLAFWLLFAAAFLFSVLTVYDTVKATGTGYFMFLSTGVLGRGAWDLLFTAFILILILVLVSCGTIVMHGGVTDAAFFFLANGALSFYVRPDKIIAPFTGGDVLDRYGVFFKVIDYLPLWTAGVVFVYLMTAASKDLSSAKFNITKAALLSAVFIAFSVIINSAFELFLFAAGFVLLLPLIGAGREKEKKLFILPAAVCFVCMIWRLYSAMALY